MAITGCVGLFCYGIIVSLLGAILPELQRRLHFDLARGGFLQSCLYIGQTPLLLGVGPFIDRLGKKPALVMGSAVCAAAIAAMPLATGYREIAAAFLLLGLGASFLNTASNAFLPELDPRSPASGLNLGNAFFSLGAVFFPLLFTLMARRFGLAAVLWTVAILIGSLGGLALKQRVPPAGSESQVYWKEACRMLSQPDLRWLAAVSFLYVALEVSTGLWLRPYAELRFHAGAKASGLLLTSFWGAEMLGRLGASAALKRVRDSDLVTGGCAGAVVGLLILLVSSDIQVALLGVILCGLAYAPIFPTTLATGTTRFPSLSGAVLSALLVAGLGGAMVGPAAMGAVAGSSPVRGIGWLIGSVLLLLAAQLGFLLGRHLSGST